MHVIKRDGRKEKFEQTKIENAINKCLKQCNYLDDKLAKLIVSSINRKIKDLNEIEVEKIQDLVEDELIHRDLKELAKSYIKYRHDRSNARQFKSSLTQIFHEINSTNSDDMDLKRENANIDANTSMGTMLKYGSEAAKDYNLKYLIKPEYAQAHINGDLHLHDLDFYSITLNCLFIPLAKLLKNGFNTGHGSIRPPQSIQSASSLACIILQSNQNEMFGGQAFPTFDYDLAPYVAKSFIKNLSNCLKFDGFDSKYHCDLKSLNEKLEDFYIAHNTIIENKDDIYKIIQNSTEFFDEIEDGIECRNDFIKCYDYAYEKPTLVMATKGTIESEKFNLLYHTYDNHKTILLPCVGLADVIENGNQEKIKQYKTNVDVLTMTATPIPRTLHMSIVGVRDMSVIYEPPHNRRPVQTYVLEYDREVIKEAITKELERDGQVFYIFNNVENIQRKVDEISRLVPEAEVSYAHGQMSGNQIEEIMDDFIQKKSNVLVCTTILESGIDIPNANTIIVENADRMGLAQLYQIRGRVGRSDRQAYAYITYKRDKLLSEVADKRLKAIKEFTEFGSGFKIAMRDLEIRGAGSLLGEIQSGHLEQVGYDTYCNLLDEVIKEMKGIEVKPEVDIQIDLNVTSYIPDDYISDANQKIEIYQDIALCKNEEDIQNVIDEIIDRFGNMPAELENLIDIARIKYLAKALNISKIASKKTAVVFTFEESEFPYDVVKLVKEYGNRLKFSAGIKPMITLEIGTDNEMKILNDVTEFLKTLTKYKKEENEEMVDKKNKGL